MSDPARAFWAWRHQYPQADPQAAYLAGYHRGGADALRASSALAGLVPKLREVIWWIEADDGDERDVERHEEYAR